MKNPREDNAAQPDQAKKRTRFVTPEQAKNLTNRELEALPDSDCIIVSGEFEEPLGPREVACDEYGGSDAVEGAADDRLSKWLEANDPRYLPSFIAIDVVDRLFRPEAEKLGRLLIDPKVHLVALKRLAASIRRGLYRDPPPEIARWLSKPDHGDVRKTDIRKAVEEYVGPVLDRLVLEYQRHFVKDLPEAKPLLPRISNPEQQPDAVHLPVKGDPPPKPATAQRKYPSLEAVLDDAEKLTANPKQRKQLRIIRLYERYLSDFNTLKQAISSRPKKLSERKSLKQQFSWLDAWRVLTPEETEQIEQMRTLKTPYWWALKMVAVHEQIAGISKRTMTTYRNSIKAAKVAR